MINKKLLFKYFGIFLSFFLILFTARSIHWIYHMFKRVNFDEIAIVLSTGATGTDSGLLMSFHKDCTFSALGIAAAISIICYLLRKKHFITPICFLICFGCLTFEATSSNIEFGSFFNFEKSNFYETEYIAPDSVDISWQTKRNVVFIALESIEKAYGNPKIFPDVLTPEITSLEKQNVSFENYNSISGLSHTIAAITGFTTGLPLFYTRIRKIEKMLGVRDGIGTIFANNGYQTLSMFPATGRFSLKENFMHRMGFQTVIDGEKISTDLISKSPDTHYDNLFGGVDDGTFFEYSKPFITNLIKSKKPYFIFMETINTHLDGYPTEYCRNLGFAQETMADITKCDDKIVGDFVKWLRKADPTAVIILVNDHTQSTGELINTLEKLDTRPLANVFINTNVFDGANFERPITAMDFFPSVIEAAGGKISGCKLGLGVSLTKRCADTNTLRERYGDIELQHKMEQKNDLYWYLASGVKK